MELEQPTEPTPERESKATKFLKNAGRLAIKTTAVVVVAGIVALPIGDRLVDRWADRATDRIKERSGQVDLSQDQIDNFKNNIKNEDLLEFFAREIQDERGDMTPQELVNCLFNDSEACQPDSDSSTSITSVVELSQSDIDGFNERFDADLAIGPGPYEPEFLLTMIFPEVTEENGN